MSASMTGIVLVHDADGTMRDTWGRYVLSGPVERWPESDPRHYDRAVPEPCDDSLTSDGCRKRDGHMGVHSPTPEQVRTWHPIEVD